MSTKHHWGAWLHHARHRRLTPAQARRKAQRYKVISTIALAGALIGEHLPALAAISVVSWFIHSVFWVWSE